GNSASGARAAMSLDTTADVGANLAVSISDQLVNSTEKTTLAFNVTGLDLDASADVTFTSSGGGTPVVVHVTANGLASVNLTGLADGTITAAILATDTAGNTASGAPATTTLDTTADVGANLAVSISDQLVNSTEKTTLAFNVTGLDLDASADVTFTSSGGGTPVVVHVT